MIKFLDCTLRDGGYYNNWDFELARAEELLSALNKSKVDIIEIGYKSPVKENSYVGLFKNCNENYLDFLSKGDYSKYCFMIDIKEFLVEDEINYFELEKYIRNSEDSIFSLVRLASHYATVKHIPKFTKYFRSKGYQVGFNLMGGSLLTNDELQDGINIAEISKVDVFYVADSFGSFYPNQIKDLISRIKSKFNGKIGIHAHDNQGLAYANVLAAIESGVDYVDGTVNGMGRGAGNLLTEQFLLGYAFNNPNSVYEPSHLLPIITEYFEELKNKYKWGYNYSYMYSGLVNIHPSYCQSIAESSRYNEFETNQILNRIPKEKRSKFSKEELQVAIADFLKNEVFEIKNSEQIFAFDKYQFNDIVIVARGESAKKNIDGIIKFSKLQNASIMECGDTELFTPNIERILILLNQVRIEDWVSRHKNYTNLKILTGSASSLLPKESNNSFFPFVIGPISINDNNLSIPDYDSGIFAILFAIRCNVKNIWLAGFDGFNEPEINNIKNDYFELINTVAKKRGINIQHITPTKYKVFKKNSIYTT